MCIYIYLYMRLLSLSWTFFLLTPRLLLLLTYQTKLSYVWRQRESRERKLSSASSQGRAVNRFLRASYKQSSIYIYGRERSEHHHCLNYHSSTTPHQYSLLYISSVLVLIFIYIQTQLQASYRLIFLLSAPHIYV